MPVETPPASVGASGPLWQLEAVGYLLLAHVVLKFWTFERIAHMLSSQVKEPPLQTQERERVRNCVRNAIFRVWRCCPASNSCFHRALAAYWMLRRRGISSQMYYGAARDPESSLIGHVWLMDGEAGVVGMDAARQLPVLACFSDAR